MHLLKCDYNTKQSTDIAFMKVIFSFDYELFFGANSGSPEKCMIEPAVAMMTIAADFGVPLCFFVDTGYLVALKRFSASSGELRRQETLFRRNLDNLAAHGHELLLHVHPHWEDAVWTGDHWDFDLARFCLSDFDDASVMDIVKRHADELRLHSKDGRIHAYRAGGWAVQPFVPIGNALKVAGIRIDSTVYPGGKDTTGKAKFDFSAAPVKTQWRFESDPAIEEPLGTFIEIPVSSMTVSPRYYWRVALSRLMKSEGMMPFGDGAVRAVPAGKNRLDKLNKLFAPTLYCVTLDGMKANLALGEYKRMVRQGAKMLVLLSHPKMMTPFSMKAMRCLLDEIKRNSDEVIGYEHFDVIEPALPKHTIAQRALKS